MTGPEAYVLVPGVEVIRLDGDDALLRSDTLALRLEGPSARLFTEALVPHLRTPTTLGELQAALPNVDAQSVRVFLDGLVTAGALTHAPAREHPAADAPLVALMTQLGRDGDLRPLRALRIAVVGLEAHGSHLAAALAAFDVGALTLVDPFPIRESHRTLLPMAQGLTVGTPRATALADALRQTNTTTRIAVSETLSREQVDRIAARCDVLVSCIDRGFAAANLWVNRASLSRHLPALYGQIATARALVGPLVVPGETACYMCWRMRAIASEEDFEAAMRFEELNDARREPAQDRGGVLPGLPAYVGSLLLTEIVKLSLGIAPSVLTGRVHEFNGLTFQVDTHTILQLPDCPACGSPQPPPVGPNRDGLARDTRPRGDLLESAPALVSARAGIVRELTLIPKDAGEPEVPYIYRAQLANRQFHRDAEARYWGCSGKGLTDDAARRSALGEAVERYGGFAWTAVDLAHAARDALGGPALDPRTLVLFAEHQYSAVPYARYEGATPMGWVAGRNLVTGDEVALPAIAVLMDYQPRTHAEHIAPITSNGLGGGSTLVEAVVAGAQEVIERDAFLLTWLNRLPAGRVDPLTHPDRVLVGVCRSYARRNVTIELYALARDHPCHVFLALGVADADDDLPAVVVGLGADVDPRVAARQAILEVGQVRPALRANVRRPATRERMEALVADPSAVRDLDDHDLLYADPRMRSAFDFLRTGPATSLDWDAPLAQTPVDKLDVLITWCRDAGRGLLYADLTPPELRRLNLFAARAILPGLQPIYFGEHERRLGGDRLFELPAQLGFGVGRRTFASLNPLPHPLA